MKKLIAIKDLKPKGFTVEDLKDVSEAFRLIPIGASASIIVGRTRDGDEKTEEYQKESETHITLVRKYNRS